MFYNIVVFLSLLLFLPKMLWDFIFLGKKRSDLLQRMGWKEYVFPSSDGKQVFWIHAVSVGETKAAKGIIERIKTSFPQSMVIVSVITNTGYEEARKNLLADKVVFLPFDFSWVVRKMLQKVKPSVVILMESDFWFSFLKESKKLGAKIFLLSGKISEKSSKRFRLVLPFAKKLFSYFDELCLQNELYQNRFLPFVSPDKIHITGNLKFENFPKYLNLTEKQGWKSLFKIKEGYFVCTLASTHEKEEKMLINAVQQLLHKHFLIKVFIAPRHPERFAKVCQLLEQNNIQYGRFSQKEILSGKEDVIVLDTLGMLNTIYQLSDLAVVAGSFIPTCQGHNILEPLFFGVPVIFGPYMQSQKELEMIVLDAKCGLQVSSQELPLTLLQFIQNRKWQNKCKENSSQLIEKIATSLSRTWKTIFPLIKEVFSPISK